LHLGALWNPDDNGLQFVALDKRLPGAIAILE
jgi:hypothetical protein